MTIYDIVAGVAFGLFLFVICAWILLLSVYFERSDEQDQEREARWRMSKEFRRPCYRVHGQ